MIEASDKGDGETAQAAAAASPPPSLPKRYRMVRHGPARGLRLPSAKARKNALPYHRASDEALKTSLERDRRTLAKGEAAYLIWRSEMARRLSAKEAALAERQAAAARQDAFAIAVEGVDRALETIPEEKRRAMAKAILREARKRAGGRTMSGSGSSGKVIPNEQ